MPKKEYALSIVVCAFLFFFHNVNAVVAYIPEPLRNCISHIHENMGKRGGNDLQELYTMITHNRVLASDSLVCRAVKQALELVKKGSWSDEWKNDATTYLETYVKNLNNRSLLLCAQGNSATVASFPKALIARSLTTDSIARDMVYLSSELTNEQNIELCGCFDSDKDVNFFDNSKQGKSVKSKKLKDPSLVFNPNMMTSSMSVTPNVLFSTGVSGSVINAWSMPVSTAVQSPINMQFVIPEDFKKDKAISVEMHFLVKKNFATDGNARIRINALYVRNESEISEPITFTHTTDSNDFFITEPTQVDGLMHVYINVPIEKSQVRKYDFVILSLTRILPDGAEYADDIYLAASVFNYTAK